MGQCASGQQNKPAISGSAKTTNTSLNVQIQKPISNENIPSGKEQIQKANNIVNTIKSQQPIIVNKVDEVKIQKIYRERLQQKVMRYVTDLPNSLFKVGTNASQPKLSRISKEISKFRQFLPCQHTNAIFVGCDQSRMDSMNVLISGSKGTPYANGLYHFELFCDDIFPSGPPKMQLLTGKNKVRFNPNMYQNGYICLSLLGTWPGQPQQSWNPLKSSLAQIFVSIQSIIMTNDIIYNQPGYQSMKGSTKVIQMSQKQQIFGTP